MRTEIEKNILNEILYEYKNSFQRQEISEIVRHIPLTPFKGGKFVYDN
jgi:hypothetical protein